MNYNPPPPPAENPVLETKYYVDEDGKYLGGFSEGNPAIPEDAIEVETPPPHGWQTLNMQTGDWNPLTQEQIDLLSAPD